MIFYGETLTGRRIHIGNWLSPRLHGREDWVYTFCGSEMRSWKEGDRPPVSRANDFCRSCFRRYAWAIMLRHLDDAPTLGSVYTETVEPRNDIEISVSREISLDNILQLSAGVN